jgi:hypothetical protein
MTVNICKALFFTTLCISITGCSTHKKNPKDTNGSDIWGALSKEPVSIGAAINGARSVLKDYDKKLSGADRTRRGFNLATIASTTYTAVGAALNVHNHNLIASTALTTILPSIEENVQPHGSPETLGSAMTKTQCIVRAGSLAMEPTALGAYSTLKLKTDNAPLNRYASERAAVTAYNAIGNQIVSAYGQVYIDYAVNRTPAQLDAKGLTEKLGKITQKETEAEADASEAQTNKKGLFANGQAAAVDLSKQVGVIEATTKASMVAINNCLKD